MAPSPITPRRPARGRPRGRPRGTATGSTARVRKLAPDLAASEPPPKKRRYVPGGPGGGGRFVDEDGNETPAEPSAATASRPRANAHASPSVFPRREPSRRTRTAVNRDELDEIQYSSAAAVAAAVVQSEGYKPREERGWEEFHPNLDIERTFLIFPSEEVDGLLKPTPPTPNAATQGQIQQAQVLPPATPLNGTTTPAKEAHLAPGSARNTTPHGDGNPSLAGSLTDTPSRRRLGRLARDSSSLYATRAVDLAPKIPKVLPIHNQTPKERLDLKLPSYRRTDRVSLFESKTFGQARYVDKSMMNVGYQESDNFIRPDRKLIKAIDANVEEDMDLLAVLMAEVDPVQHTAGAVGRVEYDMDEQDDMWLEKMNEQRKAAGLIPITREIFEITITKIEKEWHALEKRIPKPNPKPPQTHRPRSSSAAAVSGEPQAGEEQDSKCAICDDGDCENTNAIVFCDGCDLAVHQECYGVPFIPEGQWLCRKCQLIGRGVPTCIFCPNTEGAFKQTTTSKWAHLLCALWIPEVNLGNTTFMEPVMEVEKVPKTRWKLLCYICNQRMGACVQCSNKNCYQAFHVTCARRCNLYLKMKNSQGQLAAPDSGVPLKAFCDKHCPSEYTKEHGVAQATKEAKRFYKRTMKNRIWADSQASASQLAAAHRHAITEHPPDESQMMGAKVSAVLGDKKKGQPGKPIWKLPSGAPIIPQAVYNLVEVSLARFSVVKRKEFVAESCRYWTLKREARRGAALLKRLQLQMETFSSMELTRRDFSSLGRIGKVRLSRRIEFAKALIKDLEQLKSLSESIVSREADKLEAAEMQQEFVDTCYFPIHKMLVPVLDRAFFLDKNVFKAGLMALQQKLERRYYTTTLPFTHDLCQAISAGINTAAKPLAGPSGSEPAEPSPVKGANYADISNRRRLGKRILKDIEPQLQAALKAECEVTSKPLEPLLEELKGMLNASCEVRRHIPEAAPVEAPAASRYNEDVDMADAPEEGQIIVADQSGTEAEDVDMDGEADDADVQMDTDGTAAAQNNNEVIEVGVSPKANGDQTNDAASHEGINGYKKGDSDSPPSLAAFGSSQLQLPQNDPITPPQSNGSFGRDPANVLSDGGIPWYLHGFDPEGTTVATEQWTGREVLRSMSEELSDMDDEALKDLEFDVEDETITASPTVNGTTGRGANRTTDNDNADSKPAASAKKRERANPAKFRKGIRSSARRK
ncbi:hypothetical protein QBC39DRAFT_15992 [Podospora conica]|nr:hypothetical protein QBC39DRAFT_15992 [Schizothecium conicum]